MLTIALLDALSHCLDSPLSFGNPPLGATLELKGTKEVIKNLLHVSDEDSKLLEAQILARDRSQIPGTIRASFGLYNTRDEVDAFIRMVRKIAAGDYSKDYVLDKEKGEYVPRGFAYDFEQSYAL